MIYVTSDTHFCHNREFLYRPRGFSSAGEMNYAIVSNWNNTVSDDDHVYLLGDVMLNDNVEGARLLKCLKGKIHIILGNHDTDNRLEIFNNCSNVVETTFATKLKYNGYYFYLSHYPTITSNFDDGKPLKARLINLCGHSHTQDAFVDWVKYNSPLYHCELDAHDCEPISLDDIIYDINAFYAMMKQGYKN